MSEEGIRNPVPDNAGVIAPAPILYAVAKGIALVAERVAPTLLLQSLAGRWLASAFIASSIAIVVAASRALARAHIAFDACKPTTRLVTMGAFRFSRNPTYLSLTLLHIGVAFATESAWVLLMAVPAVALTQWGVFLQEERCLDAKFGEVYRSYEAKVRRWL